MRSGLARYLAVALLLRCADEGVRVVLVLLAVERTGGAALGGLLLAAWFAPHVLAAPLAGGVIDRAVAAHRPRLPYVAAFGLIGLVLLGATSGIGRVPTALVLAALAVGGCAGPLATGGLTSLLPRILPAGRVGQGFGLDAASYGTAGVAGPALAALLADLAGATVAGVVMGVMALLAVPLMLGLPLRADDRPDEPATPTHGPLDGALTLFRDRTLRAGTLASALGHAGIGALPVALAVPFAHAAGQAPAHLGLVLAAFSAGSFVGSLVHAHVAVWRARPLAGLLVTQALVAALVGVAALTPSAPVRAAVLGAAGIPAGFGFGALLLLRNERTAPAVRAQAFATGAGIKVTLAAAGAAGAGALAAAGVTGAWLIATIAGLNLLGALAGVLVPGALGRPQAGGASRTSSVAASAATVGEPEP